MARMAILRSKWPGPKKHTVRSEFRVANTAPIAAMPLGKAGHRQVLSEMERKSAMPTIQLAFT